jgi:meiotic recombination protein SPO11
MHAARLLHFAWPAARCNTCFISLAQVRSSLNIPILGLFDADPYGLKILSVNMKGSKNMSYDSINLTTPDLKWLDVRPCDLDKYNIPP